MSEHGLIYCSLESHLKDIYWDYNYFVYCIAQKNMLHPEMLIISNNFGQVQSNSSSKAGYF